MKNMRMLGDLPKERVTPNDFGRERLGRKWSSLFSWGLDRYRPIAFTVYNGKDALSEKPSLPDGKSRRAI